MLVIVMFLLFIIKYCINKFIKSNNEKTEVEKENIEDDVEEFERYSNRKKYYDNLLSESERINEEVQDKDFSYEDFLMMIMLIMLREIIQRMMIIKNMTMIYSAQF